MSAALNLVVACCRWPDDDRRRAAIANAAKRVTDWDQVVYRADRHRVEPLVANGLAATGISVPLALEEALERFRSDTIRDLGESLRIAAALTNQNISHRFLKGGALGVVAYGSPLLKRSWDIDLLVLPHDAVRAAACLKALGYAPIVPPRPLDQAEYSRWSVVSKEAEFHSPRGSTVELHWRVSDHPGLLAAINAAGPSRPVVLLGTHQVATLTDAANLAYLAVHGGTHAWFRLKWIADFNGLLASFAPARRMALLDEVRATGAGYAIDIAVALTQSLFDDDDTKANNRTSRAVLLSRQAIAASEDVAQQRAAALRWSLQPGIAYRLAEARLRLRGTLDRIDHPLPARLAFLYPWLRPFLWGRRRWIRHRSRD